MIRRNNHCPVSRQFHRQHRPPVCEVHKHCSADYCPPFTLRKGLESSFFFVCFPPIDIICARMNSMTGYGRGESSRDGSRITVEISSVNRKSAEVAVNLPRELDALENKVRDEILQCVSRGRLNVRVNLSAANGFKSRAVRINRDLARSVHAELTKLNKDLNRTEPISIDTLMRVPGVVEAGDDETDPESLWPAVKQAVGKAVDGMVQMRQKEGKHLARDMKGRIKTIQACVKTIARLAPAVPKRYRENLTNRLEKAGLEIDLNDERVLKELVIFSDRSDITEELTRLESHFQQFAETAAAKEPVGRKLDFLCQEMNREINTIGSKAQDSGISREVVTAKTELEKFREQVQNVE